jgi:hypothetical protein
MSKDLFFIATLAEAFRAEDPAANLQETLFEIEKTGEHPEYQQGLEQFYRFLIESRPVHQLRILVEQDGQVLGHSSVWDGSSESRVGGIRPGRYVIRLSTGRVIGELELVARDLIWSLAYPGRPLGLAADTGATSRAFTREFYLLGGEVQVRIYPGVSTGAMGIRVPVINGTEPNA